MPYAGQRIDTDNILIPTGDIVANKAGSLNDFWSTPKQIGANFTNPDLLGNCGYNCTGYGMSKSPPSTRTYLTLSHTEHATSQIVARTAPSTGATPQPP